MNKGLILISPVILVRLLTVHDYGRYREFLLYTTILTGVGTFGINGSLLRFIPHKPEHTWYYVNQSIAMTAAFSSVLGIAVLLLNVVFEGRLVAEYAPWVVLYAFLFINLDFWEYLWIAEKQPTLIWRYSTGRLLARILVVTLTAAITRDVDAIVHSLVALESVRIIAAAVAWRMRDAQSPVHGFGRGMWGERLRYSLPFGGALVLQTLNRQLGSVLIAKFLGPVALAHFAIGTYVQPITQVLRNSISDVLLGEMARRSRDPQGDPLLLFRRTTVVTAMFLVPCGVLLARFADIIVTTLFTADYRPAIMIFQIYVLVLLRESMDFGVPLRAINMTAPIMRSNLVALLVNGMFMAIMMPRFGLPGAVAAFVTSRMLEGSYLGILVLRAYNVGLSRLANWTDLLKILIAAALAATVLYGSFWTETLGIFGVPVAGILYVVVFASLLLLLHVSEAPVLLRQVRGYSRSLLARLQP